MLTDKELMRDNFVMFFDAHKVGHKAIVDQVLRYSCLLIDITQTSDDYKREVIVNYEDIHGIPITADLLEKNGFRKHECAAVPDEVCYMFDNYYVTQDKKDKSLWSIDCCTEYDNVEVRTVMYIHELQVFLYANECNYEIKTL